MGEANIWQPRTIISTSADTKSVFQKFTSLLAQNLFLITEFAYVVGTGALTVHKNGLLLVQGTDWTEQSTTSFSLTNAANAGDVIVAEAFVGISGTIDVRDTDIYVANYQAIRDYAGTEVTLYAQGRSTGGDGGEHFFHEITGAAPGFYTDDNEFVIVPTGGDGSAAWVRPAKIDYSYTTVASMKAASLPTGVFAKTLGYLAAGDGGGATYLTSGAASVDGFADHTLANANIALLQKTGKVFVEQFGAVANDGTTDEKNNFQAANDWRQARGGGVIYTDPNKQYALGSAVNVGTNGSEVFFNGQGSKNGTTYIALSAFTGGMFIIVAGGVLNCNATGFAKDTAGHVFMYLGTVAFKNPTVTTGNLLNNGGFYEFVATDYEYDGAIVGKITSLVEVGHAVMRLQTGTGIAHAASPVIGPVFLRNPDVTFAVGTAKKYGIILDRTESAIVYGQISNFDLGIRAGTTSPLSNRELDISRLVTLNFRVIPADWVSTNNYSVGDMVKPTKGLTGVINGHVYIATADSGSSDSSEPTWPVGHNATVVDDGITWTEVGQSVGIWCGFNQQTRIGSIRSEDHAVAFENAGNGNYHLDGARLIGDSAAYLNSGTSASGMVMVNSLCAGDFKIKGAANTEFTGFNNNLQTETALEVPNHQFNSFSTGDYIFENANGIDFAGPAKLGASATQVLARYEDDNNATVWVPTVTDQTNTVNAAITSAYYTVIGNRVFCGIRGTVDVTADNTQSDFKFTVPIVMHSATLSDIGGSISLITDNGDTAICTVISNSGGNNTDAALSIPKKSIATSGDAGTGLAFSGNFSYKIA